MIKKLFKLIKPEKVNNINIIKKINYDKSNKNFYNYFIKLYNDVYIYKDQYSKDHYDYLNYQTYKITKNDKTIYIKAHLYYIKKEFNSIEIFLNFCKKIIFEKPISIKAEVFDIEKYIYNASIDYIIDINNYIYTETIFDGYISDINNNDINNIINDIKHFKKRHLKVKEYHKTSLNSYILKHMGFNFDFSDDNIKKLFN